MDVHYPIILFDSQCMLCRRFKQAIEKIDPSSTFTFQDLHTQEIYQQWPHLNYAKCQNELHLLLGPDRTLVGPEAIQEILEKLPAAQHFLWLIDSESGKKAINFFDRSLNKLRVSLKNRCPGCTKNP